MTMNIRRGLIRVWIVISLLWVGFLLATMGPGAVSNVKTMITPTLQPSSAGLSKPLTANEQKGRDHKLSAFIAELKREIERDEREMRERGEESIGEMRYRAKYKIARWQLLNFGLGVVVLPALFWALLYTGFWIARGFKGKQ